MKVEFREISQQEAEKIAFGWHYEGQYAFYDMEADEEDLAEFLDAKGRKGTIFAAHAENELIGFISIAQQDTETVEIGLGLRPDLTGQGFGDSFMKAGLAFVKTQFSFLRIILAVASFNVRAIRLYENSGFKKTAVFKQETNGGVYDFIKMEYRLLPAVAEGVIRATLNDMKNLLHDNFVGLYIHGSLATGGFHPVRSDVDMLLVTEQPLSEWVKQRLRNIFLIRSREPFPVEISSMNKRQLTDWQHPSPFDFHFSEVWRHRTDQSAVDPDLAAHLTVLKSRGFCVHGEPIVNGIPEIPWSDYTDAILRDFEDCRAAAREGSISGILNAIRVLMALKERQIASKKEAGDWGLTKLPEEWHEVVCGAAVGYAKGNEYLTESLEAGKFLAYIENEMKQEMRNGHVKENHRTGLL